MGGPHSRAANLRLLSLRTTVASEPRKSVLFRPTKPTYTSSGSSRGSPLPRHQSTNAEPDHTKNHHNAVPTTKAPQTSNNGNEVINSTVPAQEFQHASPECEPQQPATPYPAQERKCTFPKFHRKAQKSGPSKSSSAAHYPSNHKDLAATASKHEVQMPYNPMRRLSNKQSTQYPSIPTIPKILFPLLPSQPTSTAAVEGKLIDL